MPITDYNTSAALNLTLGTIPVGPGMEREKVNNAFQQIMADIKTYTNSVSNAIYVEDYGAVGDGIANDQPAIQNAINAAILKGGVVRCLSNKYALWTPLRVGTGDIHANTTGFALVVNGKLIIESAVGRTDFFFYSPTGTSLATNWQLVNYPGLPNPSVWRGAGIFLRGTVTDPGRQNRNRITLRGIYLQGGCLKTSSYTFPANTATGDGWDLQHKGVWAENDYYTGDIELHNSGVIGFRGELIYQGGLFHGGLICRGIELAQCNANAFNPNSAEYVDIDGAYVHDVYHGWEGWTGTSGRLVNALFKDCVKGGARFSGGIHDTSIDPNFVKTKRKTATELPIFHIEATFINCGLTEFGSYVHGHVKLIDTKGYITSRGAGDFVSEVNLTVDAIADQIAQPAFAMDSGINATSAHRDIKLRINTSRSEAARLAARHVQEPIQLTGFYNPGVEISGEGMTSHWPRALGAGVSGTYPKIVSNWINAVNEGNSQNITITANTVITPQAGHVLLTAATAGPFDIGITTANYQVGAEVVIYCEPTASAAFRFVANTNGIKLRAANYTLTGKRITFRFDGATWNEMRVENWA